MFTISLLKNHPSAIKRLSHLWYEVLGKVWMQHISLKEVEAWLLEWNNTDHLPLAHVAFAGNIPIGMCSLQINDGVRTDLSPWLGDLCVDPEYQQQGVGKMLIEATKSKAKELHFDILYLFTFDQKLIKYYYKQGWHSIGTDQFGEHRVFLLASNL